MKRWFTKFEALRGRVDRPHSRMLVVATALALPAGLVVLAAGPTEAPVAMDTAPRGPSLAEKVSMARDMEGEVAGSWLERALMRERARAGERFAQQFSISPELAGHIYAAARAHDIEPQIAFGLVRAESSFRRTVVSHAGAVGYTQLLPSTARWIAPGTTRAALFNTETNLDVGFRYLRYLKDKYNGNVDLALTAYNRGQGTVDRLLRQGRNPDNGYAAAVRTGKVSRTLIRQNSPRG
jgi:soluble lytic murein transglycosylase-like protein